MKKLSLKKGTIFGMEPRALKKQFGKLFLARVRSVDSLEIHGASIHYKRGAIFGMDARIAIFVFSIIGMVATYYSYDRITEGQQVSLVNQVDTLRNAALQNIADNGFDYLISGTTTANNNIFGQSNGANLGRGRNNYAYVNNVNASSSNGEFYIATPNRNIEVDFNYLYASIANNGVSYSYNDCINTSSTCHYWIKFLNVNDESYKLIEEYYDGTSTSFGDATARSTGIVIGQSVNVPTDTAVMLVKVGER